MKITDIKIRKILTSGNLKAIVSITIDNCLAIHDVKIVQGNSRVFVAMPCKTSSAGVHRDLVHPIYSDTRDEFERVILRAYRDYMGLFGTNQAQ